LDHAVDAANNARNTARTGKTDLWGFNQAQPWWLSLFNSNLRKSLSISSVHDEAMSQSDNLQDGNVEAL
jgi:hypothetical protein